MRSSPQSFELLFNHDAQGRQPLLNGPPNELMLYVVILVSIDVSRSRDIRAWNVTMAVFELSGQMSRSLGNNF
jgi:hypothetical protein